MITKNHPLSSFIRTSILGGFIVVLPIAILYFVFKAIFDLITKAIQPLTDIILLRYEISEIFADAFVVSLMILGCFMIGVLIKTQIGSFLHSLVERRIMRIPGYVLIKETIMQFIGNKKMPFSQVALARLFSNETLVTVFVTGEHEDGSFTVFMPTGPNPTSGNIYHLPAKDVTLIDVSVEDAMKSVIGCGTNSERLISSYRKKS